VSHNLPVIGAALYMPDLDRHRDWLIESQRDLEIQDFIFPEVLDGDLEGFCRDARARLDGFTGRLGIHGPFYNLPLNARDPLIRDVVKRRLWQGLDACEWLGATHMVVHSPYTTWGYNNLDKTPTGREELIEYCHLTMADAVRRAETIGCTLVIENIEDKDPSARVELARSFESEAVGVSIDTGHAYYAHGTTGAPPVDYFVKLAGKHLAHVHIQDADGYADRHWPPGAGTLNWRAFFEALAQSEANPRLVLELDDNNRILEGAAWLIAEGLAR